MLVPAFFELAKEYFDMEWLDDAEIGQVQKVPWSTHEIGIVKMKLKQS
jgi:hypothetical protein